MRGMGAVAGVLVGVGAIGLGGQPAEARQDSNLSTTAMPPSAPSLLDQLRQEVSNTQQTTPAQPATSQPAPQHQANPAPGAAAPAPAATQTTAVTGSAPASAPVRLEDMTAEQRQTAAMDLMAQGSTLAAQTISDTSTQSQLKRIITTIGSRGPVPEQQMNEALNILRGSTTEWGKEEARLNEQARGVTRGTISDADLEQLNAQITARRETAVAQVNDFLRSKVQIALFTRIEREEALVRDPNRGGLLDRIGSDLRRAGDDITDFGRDIVTVTGHPSSGPAVARNERRANQEFYGANPRDAETSGLLNRVTGNCRALGFDIMNSEKQTRAAAESYVESTGRYRNMSRTDVDAITNGTLVPRASTVEAVRELNSQVEQLSAPAQTARGRVETSLETIQARLTPEQWARFQAVYEDHQVAATRVSRLHVQLNPRQSGLPVGVQAGDARKIISNFATGNLQQGAAELDTLGAQFLDAVNERGAFARR